MLQYYSIYLGVWKCWNSIRSFSFPFYTTVFHWDWFDQKNELSGPPSHVTWPFEYQTTKLSGIQLNSVSKCLVFIWLTYSILWEIIVYFNFQESFQSVPLPSSLSTSSSLTSVNVAIQTPSKLLKGLVEGAGAVAFSKKAMEKEFKQFAEKVLLTFKHRRDLNYGHILYSHYWPRSGRTFLFIIFYPKLLVLKEKIIYKTV